jgi:hypothetical protein
MNIFVNIELNMHHTNINVNIISNTFFIVYQSGSSVYLSLLDLSYDYKCIKNINIYLNEYRKYPHIALILINIYDHDELSIHHIDIGYMLYLKST